jgi:hypothetical protein
MAQPGLYLFKRPVHSSGSNNGGSISAESLLKQAGSIMHHIILYVKTEDEVRSRGTVCSCQPFITLHHQVNLNGRQIYGAALLVRVMSHALHSTWHW